MMMIPLQIQVDNNSTYIYYHCQLHLNDLKIVIIITINDILLKVGVIRTKELFNMGLFIL